MTKLKFSAYVTVRGIGLIQHVVRADSWQEARDRVERAHPNGKLVAVFRTYYTPLGNRVDEYGVGSAEDVMKAQNARRMAA